MRRLLIILLLLISLTLAVLATIIHRPVRPLDFLRHYVQPQWTLGNCKFFTGINDFGGFSFSIDHHLAAPLPWPPAIAPRPDVYQPPELLITLHNGSGFTYAVLESAPAPFAPLDHLHSVFVAPYWFMMLLYLAFPILWPITRRLRASRNRRRATSAGLCPTCHYDLRAHHPGTLCPECATPVLAAPRP